MIFDILVCIVITLQVMVDVLFFIGLYYAKKQENEEQIVAHWVKINPRAASCSKCGKIQYTNGLDTTPNCNIHYAMYHYCPKCGAKMEVENDRQS